MNARREETHSSIYDVALLLASDPDFARRVEQLSEAGTDPSESPDSKLERISKRAWPVYMFARVIVWCERIAPKLPVEKAAGLLWLLCMLVLLYVVTRRVSEPTIEQDAESNRLIVKIPIGPDDDVGEQFKLARRLAREQQPRLLGYRAAPRGPARNERSKYFLYLALSKEMRAPAIIDHWQKFTTSWSEGIVPRESAPEAAAYREWLVESGEPEGLEPTNVNAALRSLRAHHEAVERAYKLPADGITPSVPAISARPELVRPWSSSATAPRAAAKG